MIIHPIKPIFDKNSRVLILGSFPSVVSREEGFFYMHPRNRFWTVLAKLFAEKAPETTEERKRLLLKNRIAVWDVIKSCEIKGSSDASIKNAVPNDLNEILSVANIKQIFVNGKTAEKYYDRYIKPKIGRDAICLPSTSPANAAWSLDGLVSEWNIIKSIQE